MTIQTINEFYVIGIAVRTSNENNQSSVDIPKLWETFFEQGISSQISNKVSSSIYCLYTDYERDHTLPYTAILGYRVESLKEIPENMVGIVVKEGKYTNFKVKGVLAEGLVYQEWLKIWESDLPRAFTTDFEIYVEKEESEQAEVEICIALN